MSTVVHSVKEGQRFAGDTNLTVVNCATCHMTYAIPTSLYKSAVAWPGDAPRGWKLSCPLGHDWWYVGESKDQTLERVRNQLAGERARHDQTQASLRAQRGVAKRHRRERDEARAIIGEGVCPVDGCHRHFKDVERHMARMHPDYGDRCDLPKGDAP